MRFIYAIPRSINIDFYTSNDVISNYINNSEKISYRIITLLTKITVAMLIIVILLLPTKWIKRIAGVEKLIKFPFEIILLFLFVLYYWMIAKDVPIRIVRETISGEMLRTVVLNGFKLNTAKHIVNFINLMYWMCLYSATILITCMFKMVYIKGIGNYIRNNSLVYKLVMFLARGFYSFMNKIIRVDFSKKYEKLYLSGLLLIIFGMVIAIVLLEYDNLLSMILFFAYIVILIVYIKIVRESIVEGTRDYKNLLELTKRIADGNLDEDISNGDVEDIIERFRRGDKSRNIEGSGLGLSIAKSYIEAMDGTFKIELDGDLFKAAVSFNKSFDNE